MPDPFDNDDELDDLKLKLPPLPPEYEGRLREFLDKVRKPLSTGDPRRHHFIPQFFLKRFANKDEQLAVVRLDEPGTSNVVSITKVAVMKDLYMTIDVEVGETVAVERILAVADGDADGVITRLAPGLCCPLQPADRASLALWLGLLYVRDPYTRRTMEALADQTFKMDLSLVHDADTARARLRNDSGEEPDGEEVEALLDAASDLDSFEITPHQNDLVRMMLDVGLSLFPHLLGRLYSVVRFSEPGLVLCDRPMVLYRKPENRSPFLGVGPGNADEIWLPLDRSTALILHSDPAVGEVIFDAPLGYTVDDFNQAVVRGANSEIYCHPDDLGRLGQLEFPDPSQPLFQMSGGSWMKGDTDGVNKPPARNRHRRYRR